jgi:hypothetical protein
MSRMRNTALLVLAALAGIAVAAAITWGTSQLVRQHIGLSSEPLTAGSSLVPPAVRRPAAPAPPSSASATPERTAAAPPAPAPATPAPAPSEAGARESAPATPPAASGTRGRRAEGGDASEHRDD